MKINVDISVLAMLEYKSYTNLVDDPLADCSDVCLMSNTEKELNSYYDWNEIGEH